MRPYFTRIALAAVLAAACSAPEEETPELGAFAVGLTDDVDGVTYRLRNARFRISGPTTAVLSSERNPDAATIETALRSGSYQVQLQRGWALEDVDTHRIVEAELASTNPLNVEIRAGATSQALFRFQIGEGSVGNAPRIRRSPRHAHHPAWRGPRKHGKLEILIEVAPRDVRQWRGPLKVEANVEGIASYPQVTIDAAGNALAVWVLSEPVFNPDENDITGLSIVASRFVAGSGWETPVRVSNNTGFPWFPEVGGNAAGEAVAIWQQDSGIWVSHFEVGSGWGNPVQIGDGEMGITGPQVAMDAAGNAIAVWEQEGIWVNRFEAGVGWGTALPIANSDTGACRFPQLATNAAGAAVATFQQFTSGHWLAWASRFEVGSGWAAPVALQDATTDASVAAIALDTAGNAITTWGQTDGTTSSSWYNRYVVGRGWLGAALIEAHPGPLVGPQVAVDGAGNAIAVWTQPDGTVDNLLASRFEVASGWGAPTLLENGAETASRPYIAMNAAGSAVVVWSQITAPESSHTWGNRFTPAGGWEGAVRLDSEVAWGSLFPQVAINEAGDAVAVWMQWWSDEYSNIWSNPFN